MDGGVLFYKEDPCLSKHVEDILKSTAFFRKVKVMKKVGRFTYRILNLFVLTFVLVSWFAVGSSSVLGQPSIPTPESEVDNQSDSAQDKDDDEPKKEKRGSLVIAPIPISSPDLYLNSLSIR